MNGKYRSYVSILAAEKKSELINKKPISYLLISITIIGIIALVIALNLGSINAAVAHPAIQTTPEPNIHADGWDLNFGEDGRVDTGCYREKSDGAVRSTLLFAQPDGKIIFSAYCDDEWTLSRFNTDGSLDTAFGTDGKVLTSFQVAAIQPDGKLITRSGVRLRRFNADGSVDKDFGSNGTANQLGGQFTDGRYAKTVVTDDGSIIAVGSASDKPIIAKFTSDGVLDSTFNQMGYILTDPPPLPSTHSGFDCSTVWSTLFLQDDGNFIVVGCAYRVVDEFTGAYKRDAILVRYKPDGSIDQSFGDSGTVTILNSIVKHLFQKPTDTIGLVVSRRIAEMSYDGEILHDTNAELPDIFTSAYSFAADTQGRVITVNDSTPPSIGRWLSNGDIDASYGIGGIVTQPAFASFTENLLLESDTSLLLPINVSATTEGAESEGSERNAVTIVRHVDVPKPEPAPEPTPPTEEQVPLALHYAVLDNNLGEGSGWSRLVNNIEAGAREGVNIELFIDGPALDDVYVYRIMPDDNPLCPSQFNPTCNGRYEEGVNFWRLPSEDTANPASLYQFLVNAAAKYPNPAYTTLTLIGHGSGWSANVLPGQPSIWREQSDSMGGMLWDDNPSAEQASSHSMSTQALRRALKWAEIETGQHIDLLYLDGCAMGMIEVAYELREHADYLLASANIDWASFNYNELLPVLATATSPAQVGRKWLKLEAAQLRDNPGHPFTLALTNLNKVENIATSVSTLATELNTALLTQRGLIKTAFANAERFDSNFDGKIDNVDSYTDLGTFAAKLSQTFPSQSAVATSAEALQTALDLAIIDKDFESGAPWLYPEEQWTWESIDGLSAYLPLDFDEERRSLHYVKNRLRWAEDTTWDEFLDTYWAEAGTVQSVTVCEQTTDGCVGLGVLLPEKDIEDNTENNILLPMIMTK